MRNMKTTPINDESLAPQESRDELDDFVKVLVNAFIRLYQTY